MTAGTSPDTSVPAQPVTTRIYLDTNVYNRLADELAPEQVRGLSSTLAARGMPAPLLSPVNIIEIVQTSDPLRREKLVYVVQHLCAARLLVEPEHLIADFIAETAGPELAHFRIPDVFCRSEMQAVWRDVRENPDKTFVFPEQARAGMRFLRSFDRLLHAFFSRGGDFTSPFPVDLRGLDGDAARQATEAARLRFMQEARVPEGTFDRILLHVLWLLIVRIVAVGVTLFPEVLDDLWNQLVVEGAEARVNYAFDKMQRLRQEGPLVLLAAWLATCATRRFDQGDLLDGYHLMYLPYVHRFLTMDENVLAFARRYLNPTTAKVEHGAGPVEKLTRS
jgi:hypothetical protein